MKDEVAAFITYVYQGKNEGAISEVGGVARTVEGGREATTKRTRRDGFRTLRTAILILTIKVETSNRDDGGRWASDLISDLDLKFE